MFGWFVLYVINLSFIIYLRTKNEIVQVIQIVQLINAIAANTTTLAKLPVPSSNRIHTKNGNTKNKKETIHLIIISPVPKEP